MLPVPATTIAGTEEDIAMRPLSRQAHPFLAPLALSTLPLLLALVLAVNSVLNRGLVGATATSGSTVTQTTAAAATSSAATTTLSTTTATTPDIASAAAAVRPATVLVLNLDQSGTAQAAGSGFIIDSSGVIVTNNHVVEGAQGLKVQLPEPDGRTFVAQVVGTDPQTDLAVLQIDATCLPTVTLGSSSDLAVGEWVVAVGNALALEGDPTVTAGVVSATGRDVEQSATGARPGQAATSAIALYDLIQTDAAINEGDSGGPLVNLQGQVVGINTLGTSDAQGIGFAIAIDDARPIIEQLRQSGQVTRAYLGIQAQTVTSSVAAAQGLVSTSGALITQVQAGTPAAQAGLRVGDVITGIGSVAVKGQEDLQTALLNTYKPGDIVTVQVNRNGTTQTISVTHGEQAAR
jgi:serine protease Do